jgi:diguanylate cyclase (GGDEF)-like protein
MDYGTFFFTNIVSTTVFAVCLGLLAWRNRTIRGLGWFAGSLFCILVKLVLQGLEGKAPIIFTGMLQLEIYTLSFLLQGMGLRWFVMRQPVRRRWPFIALALVMALYFVLFLFRVPYVNNVLNIPCLIICAVTAHMLWKHRSSQVTRVALAVVCGQMMVIAYRACLSNLRYKRPWQAVDAQRDPHWLYSLAFMALLTTCMVMCYLWYLVTELSVELERQARTDSLTGALNRRALEEGARREASRALRHHLPLCMALLDVDHFKQVNDTRGHAGGDCALQALVCQVKTMLRANDLLARTGGEEFSILLPDTDLSAAMATAERIRTAIEALTVPFGDDTFAFTVSLGVAQFDPAEGNWEDLMRRADAALYRAKDQGRNLVAASSEPQLLTSH